MGNLNTYIYQLAAQQAKGQDTVYHTSVPGYNGLVNTNLTSTYSLTVGVGTPIVRNLIGQPNVAAAGLPQTKSNP